MYNQEALKSRLTLELEQDKKFSAIAIITIVSISIEILFFLYNNCYMKRSFIKKCANRKNFVYNSFIKKHVYPQIEKSNLSNEEKNISIEKIRQLIIEDKLDDFINENSEAPA